MLTGSLGNPWWRVQSRDGQQPAPPRTSSPPSAPGTGRARRGVEPRRGQRRAEDPGGGGSLFLREGRGQRAGGRAGAHPAGRQVAAPQRVLLTELGKHRGRGRAAGGPGGNTGRRLWAPPAPLPSPRGQRVAAARGDPHPLVPVTPGCAWGPAQRGRGTLFYALKPRYPQPRAAPGRAPRSRQQQAALSPCPARRGEPVRAWGSGQPWDPLPAWGSATPLPPTPLCQQGSQTRQPVPAAAPERQRLPAGTTTSGCCGYCGTGAAPGVLELPWGTGSSPLRGVTPGGGSSAALASGSRERVVLGLFISGGGCVPEGLGPHPALGPGGHCHVL